MRLHTAQIKEISEAGRVMTCTVASFTWNMVIIADRRSADTMFKVFHSLTTCSMKISQLYLNLLRAGDTVGGFQSFGKSTPLAQPRIILSISGLETCASSKILDTREKYSEGKRRSKCLYSWINSSLKWPGILSLTRACRFLFCSDGGNEGPPRKPYGSCVTNGSA